MPPTFTCQPKFGGFASNPAGATFGPRRLQDYEFVWMLRGDSVYHWDDQSVAVPAHSVVLCRPGVNDAFDWDPRHRSQHAYIHFDLPHPPKHWPAAQHWPRVRTLPEGDVFRPMFRHLLHSLSPGNPAHLALTLTLLLDCFIQGDLRTQPPPSLNLPEPVATVLKHIHEQLRLNPARPIHLNELAEVAHLHPASLCRLFKQATGLGPVETLRMARLDLALQSLTRSTSPIKTIAADTGFASPYHFSRRFKEAFGQSPSDIRNQIQNGTTPPLPLLHQFASPSQ